MCLQHAKFRELLSSPDFAAKICSIVIDEAHCISQWGKDFRPEYAKLGTLRSFVPVQVPFLVTSATLPSPIHVHLGTDRPNIAWFTRTMKGGKKDLESLGSLLLAENMTVLDVPQTLVFFDEINVAIEALKHGGVLEPRRSFSGGFGTKISGFC